MASLLTADDFLAGVRCLKLLWYRRHQPHRDEPSLYRAYQADQLRRLREVALGPGPPDAAVVRASGPGGATAVRASGPRGSSLEATAEAVEASGETRSAILLRPVTSVKEALVWEAAFLDYVFAAAGAPVDEIRARYLDKSYRRVEGDRYEGLITEVDLTRRARGRRGEVEERLTEMADVLSLSEARLEERVEPCRRRHCPVCARAERRLERLEERAARVEAAEEGGGAEPRGRGELSRAEEIELAALRNGRPHVEAAALEEFFNELRYPLFFLDFEAYSEAVPSLAGVAPWEHVPVIYSLHRLDAPSSVPVHTVYSSPPEADGRAALFRDVASRLGNEGSILVYGKGFERKMLEQLAPAVEISGLDPVGEELAGLVDRLVDLSAPFARHHYYHPGQLGSASLKAVYRALVGTAYEDLEVADGRAANVFYYFLRYGFPEGHEPSSNGFGPSSGGLLEKLEHYCSLDTAAMIEIVRALQLAV